MTIGTGSAGRENYENLGINRQPLAVYENFIFSESGSIFPEPFASDNEVFGFLSASESWTLCSKGEPIYSRGFVQCGGALIRNRQTRLVTLIHESLWSASADVALALQGNDDLDVITIDGPFGGINFKEVKDAHQRDPNELIRLIENVDIEASRKYKGGSVDKEGNVHLFGYRSALLGLSESEVQRAVQRIKAGGNITGLTREVAKIKIPVSKSEGDRWYLLYRPKENIIWIYESGAKKLFKYKGF